MTRGYGPGKIDTMSDRPRLLCPQCGRNLHGLAATCCPNCGFVVGPTRAQYRDSVRYWQFLRARSRTEFVLTLMGIAGLAWGYRLVAISPSTSITVLLVIVSIAMIGLGKFLSFRRRRNK